MPLMENNEYKLEIKINDTTFNFNFLTKLNPSYSTIRVIRHSLIGDKIQDISDHVIAYLIYDNSVLAEEIAEVSENPFDTESPPLYVRKFVEEKTKYDLLFKIYLDTASNSGKDVALADFSIEVGQPEGMEELLELLRKNLKDWEDTLKGLNRMKRAKPRHVLKSENSPYPLGERTF